MGENAEIFQRLGKIEQMIAKIDERTARQDAAHNDHEVRIRELKSESDKRKGMVAALSLFSSVVGGVLVWLFKSIFGGAS